MKKVLLLVFNLNVVFDHNKNIILDLNQSVYASILYLCAIYYVKCSYRMTYTSNKQIIKEFVQSWNITKITFTCENDWHDDSIRGSLPNMYISFYKVYHNSIQSYRFLFWQSFIASMHKFYYCSNLMTLFV